MTGSSTRPLRAVIFDVDGTLAETERNGHRWAFNEALRSHDLPYHWSVGEYGRLLRTTGGRRRLAQYFGEQGHDERAADHLAAAVHETKTALFVEWIRSEAARPRPGVTGLLKDLQRNDVALAIATTGSKAWVHPLLERLFPGVDFRVIVTGDDVGALKPDPEVYLHALHDLGRSTADAVAIEDSPPGLAAAVAAGLPCLVVTSAYTRGEAFPHAAAVVPGYLGLDTVGADDPATPGCLGAGVTHATLTRLHAARS